MKHGRALVSLSLLASIMVCCLAKPVWGETSITGPAAGGKYSVSQLADMSKEQLIEIVIQLQKSPADPATVAEGQNSLALVAPSPHRKSRILIPIVAALAGGIAIASLSMVEHRNDMRRNSFSVSPASSRRATFARFPDAAATAASACDTNVQFSCGPYPIHQSTCNALAALTTSEGTITPLLTGKTAPTLEQTNVDKDTPNSTKIEKNKTTTTTDGVQTTQTASAAADSSQLEAAGLGLGIHLFQIFGNCANGSPASNGSKVASSAS